MTIGKTRRKISGSDMNLLIYQPFYKPCMFGIVQQVFGRFLMRKPSSGGEHNALKGSM